MKTILITGINGFLGSHLAKTLSKDYHIIGLVNSKENLYRLNGYDFHIYTAADNLESVFQENTIFAIVHAATVYKRNEEPVDNLIETNILLPVRLYEFAKKYDVKTFLNTDTFFNDPNQNYQYLPEYTLSKKQVIEWIKMLQKNVVIINMKIFHMYGPNDTKNKFIPNIISNLTENIENIDLSPGEQTRDFIFIDDVVSAYKTVLAKQFNFTEKIIEFEIGTGKSTTIKEMVLTIKEISKSNSNLCFGALAYRNDEIMKSKADNSKLLKLGWKPLFDIQHGLNSLINAEHKN